MYKDSYSKLIRKQLAKLKKKSPKDFMILMRKIDWILENPYHEHKFLRYSMKLVNRIHIGHFVLVFWIDHGKKLVHFEHYKHHDEAYLE